MMNKFLPVLLLLLTLKLSAQNEVVELGILPTEYGEGMPPADFLDIEEQIVASIKNIPRYRIVKTQEDFYDAQWGNDWFSQLEVIRKQKQQTSAPYLIQIIFGDTEWSSSTAPPVRSWVTITPKKEETETKTEDQIRKKEAKKNAEQEEEPQAQSKTPVAVPARWTHSAKIWVTLNLYKVETGELEKSETFTATSAKVGKFEDAAFAAKRSIIAQVSNSLKNLIPLEIELLELVEKTSKAIKKIAVAAGTYHGLKENTRLYVYYEHEHLIHGKKVIREIYVGTLMIEEISEKRAVCKVKKGGKELLALLQEKKLKCKIKDFFTIADGIGF